MHGVQFWSIEQAANFSEKKERVKANSLLGPVFRRGCLDAPAGLL